MPDAPSNESPSPQSSKQIGAAKAQLDYTRSLVMNRAREGRVAPPEPVSAPPSSDLIESSYQRGKTTPQAENLLKTLKDRTTQYLKETFVPSYELKGSDKVTTDGQTRTRFFAPAIDDIRTMHADPRNAREEAQKTVKGIFGQLTPDEYDVARRYIFLRDAHENITRDMEHRPGFDAGTVTDEINKLEPIIAQHPDIQQSLDSYKRVMNSMRDVGVEEGLMHKVDREWYFPHTILDFTDLLSGNKKILGVTVPRVTAGGVRWNTPSNFKQRLGSARDISTNLADQMENYLTDVSTQLVRRRKLNELGALYDIHNNPQFKDKLGNPVTHVKEVDQVPPGFVKWDPNASGARFRASSMAERYIGEMMDFGSLDALANHVGVDPVEFRQALEAVGIDNPENLTRKLGASLLPEEGRHVYVVPEELAKTMNKAVDRVNNAESLGLSAQLTRRWKSVVLNMAPVRYNFRNFIGDFNRMYAQFGNEVLDGKRWARVTRSVHDYYSKGLIDDLMQQMLDHGISSSGRIQSEYMLSRTDPTMRSLEHGLDQSNLKKASDAVWKVLSYLPEKSSVREDIVRGIITDMNNSRLADGKPLLAGVADKELVKGLQDRGEHRRAVSYISRKSLLDYGDFTPTENRWRNGWMPFYSWASGNTQFWSTLAKNAATAPMTDGSPLARATAGATLKGAAGMAAVYATVHAWNDLVMGQAEDQLPENVQKQLHFILPDYAHWQQTGDFRAAKDDEGRIKYWNTPDALDDFLTYVGIDQAIPEAMSLMRGTVSKDEWARRQREHFGWMGGAVPKGPVRTVLSQLGPAQQLVMQGIGGKRLFPDPLAPSDIPNDQRLSAMRDVFGLSALPGVEDVANAGTPGTNIFQPSTKLWDVGKQLGFGSAREPNLYMTGGATLPEADLIRRINQKTSDLSKLKSDLTAEMALKSNRQLDAGARQQRFGQRMVEIQQLTDELKDLGQRYQNLARTHRFHTANPR